MAHPLYGHALRCVGKQVNIYHVNGLIYTGTLTHVTPTGVYLLNTRPVMGYASLQGDSQTEEPTLIFYPGAFFAFGAMAGLGLGLAASALWW